MRHIPISKQYFAAFVQSLTPRKFQKRGINRHRTLQAQSHRTPQEWGAPSSRRTPGPLLPQRRGVGVASAEEVGQQVGDFVFDEWLQQIL